MEVSVWYNEFHTGEVPEWLNGTVSKTVVELVSTVGSNPTLSAVYFRRSTVGTRCASRKGLIFKSHPVHIGIAISIQQYRENHSILVGY